MTGTAINQPLAFEFVALILISLCTKIFMLRCCKTHSNTESLFIKVHHCGSKYLLAAVYLPPDSSWEYYTRLLLAIEDAAAALPDQKLLVCGDFNLRKAFWNNDPLIEHAFTSYLSLELRDSADRVFKTFATN